MKRRLILVNLSLLGLVAALALQLRSQWKSYQLTHHSALLNAKAERSNQPGKTAMKPLEVLNYSAIVDNHLFTPDRNNIIPPDVTVPAKTLPKPVLTGVIGLGEEEFALMISADPKEGRDSKRLKVGESISGYTLVKIFDQKVLMGVDGQEVEIRISEPTQLVAREINPPAPPVTPSNSARVSTVGSAAGSEASSASAASGRPAPNGALPRPQDVPDGTVIGNKKKVVNHSPFGDMVVWVDVK